MNNQIAFLIGYALGLILTWIVAECKIRELMRYCAEVIDKNEKLLNQLEASLDGFKEE